MNLTERLNRRLAEEHHKPGTTGRPKDDFESLTMRRVDGALMEIKQHVDALLVQIEQYRTEKQLEATHLWLQDYTYHIDMISGMVDRLKHP